MSETLTKNFPGKNGNYAVSLRVDRFNTPDAVPLATRGKHDRKYNLKIRQEDLVLLDALASQKNIPRSVLLNNLLHEILLDELMSIKEHDVRLLLAQKADSRAHYDELSSPWVFDAIQTECSQILENIKNYNRAELYVQDDLYAPQDYSWNSEKYSAVKVVLERMEK
ncbi:hypothetical protein E0E52_09805 [Azotobacter chroococcum]|uniref:hypothetical protein n=1 Tax=Azotobacter chroococcum TaxID=353 RepID=UPI00103B11D3|nr:hypothetical protein [Azotobacter chroococcum]TBW08062.1 hypothetical protein E0E52_09805 [Azotobacter chroococcum]